MFVAALLFSDNAFAQLPTANLTRMEPHVGKAGDSVELNLIGENLDQLTGLRFTHPGIAAEPVLLPADDFYPSRINGTRFKVSIAEDVPAGIYEARAVGYFGLSTARPFVVAAADSNEINETAGNNDPENAMPVEINSIVNGTIASRAVDWFKFTAKSNQTVLLEVVAERIDSRLDSQLILYDADGRELDRNRDTYGRDSVLRVRADRDAEYYVALSDILFRGGSEHFYRLRIHDQPHVDYVFPPAGQPGSTGRYSLHGANLPGESIETDIALANKAVAPSGFFPGQPRQGILPGFVYQHGDANPVRIGFATAPVVIEDFASAIQEVSIPAEIAGRFDQPDDEDSFRFTTKKGVTYCVETIADRMGFAVDPCLLIHQIDVDEQGSETLTLVADNDDMPSFFSVDGKDSINADTSDAAVSFTAQRDGPHQVTIVNQFGDGGPAHIYRLAIRQPTPDFQLIATTERPLATNRAGYSVTPHLRRGARWGIRVICPRQDGFAGDILVTAEDLPAGVTAKPLTLSGKTDQGILVVSADSNAQSWSGDIRIVGRAKVAEAELVREARFACLVWGHIFADSIRVRSRLTERVPLSVNQHENAPVVIEPAEDKIWTVEIGKQLEIPIKVTDNGSRTGNLTIEPRGLFGMLRSPPTVNIAENESTGTLKFSFAPNGNFQVTAGHHQFSLHSTGVAKYRQNVKASIDAVTDQQRIDKLVAQIAAESEQAKVALEQARAALASITQKTNALSAEAKAAAQEELEKAKLAVQTAEQTAKTSAEKLKLAEQARTEITKRVKSTSDTAKEKNTNFAAWSELITVNVIDPNENK